MHQGDDRVLRRRCTRPCERLPVPVAHAALARYGFIEA
jgi:hypothetical protein